jgi:hypothetical protein
VGSGDPRHSLAILRGNLALTSSADKATFWFSAYAESMLLQQQSRITSCLIST